MNLLESILLLIESNNELIKNPDNKKIREKMNKLRYYFLISLENAPDKAIVVKHYLENKIVEMEKNDINNGELFFIKELLSKVEKSYLMSLKDLTLNQKRNFFARDFSKLLYKKDEEFNKNIAI